MGRRKPFQEKSQPQNDSPATVSAQAPEAEADAAQIQSDQDERKAIQAMAAAEERRTAELVAQVQAAQTDPLVTTQEDESLVAVMAQGREHLLQKMREHAAAAEAKKNSYVPPPMTDRQRQRLEEEQAAGRKARERHEAKAAVRPPPRRDPTEGTNTPVYRPGDAVPDPFQSAPSGFIAGRGSLDVDGVNRVLTTQS